ncbi:MAG: flippase-like domain-containing protein [Actinobacteria bacterium]|nr:flippase-like domain-containing protein [Actinomycetota bacterium]
MADLRARAERLLSRSRRWPSPRAQRRLLAVASVGFVAGGVAAVRGLELDPAAVRWGAVAAVAVVGVPLTVLANAVEYAVSARVVGRRVALGAATRIAVLATAANLLPMPGAALVRVQGLRSAGAGYGRAASSTAAVGLSWLGVAALLAGLSLLTTPRWGVGPALAGAGAALLGAAFALTASQARDPRRRRRLFVAVCAVETAAVMVKALRYLLLLYALDAGPDVAGAAMLTLAGVLAAAAGLLPGGFGLRELLAALLAPVAGVSAAVGFLASALDRVVGLVALSPVAAFLAARRPS